MQCQDIPANTATEALLAVGFDNPSLSEFEHCAVADVESGLDKDWFRVELQEGKTYLFNVTNLLGTARVDMAIYDVFGRAKPVDDAYTFNSEQSFVRYSARYSGTHFLEVGQRSSFYDYRVAAREITTDNIADNSFRLRSSNGIEKFDRLTASDEADIFYVRFKSSDDIQYRIDVTGVNGFGGPLQEPIIRVRDSVAEGQDGQASLVFQPTGNGFYQQSTVVVEGNGGVGNYRIAINTVDRAGVGIQDSVRLLWQRAISSELRTSRYAVAKNHFIDVKRDIDWFNIELQAGKRYRFELSDPTFNQTTILGGAEGHVLPALVFRGPDERIIEIARMSSSASASATIDFVAKESGTHYLIARNSNGGDVGEYRLTARQYKRPPITTTGELGSLRRLLLVDSERRSIKDMFNLAGMPTDAADQFQLYSTADLEYRGEVHQSGSVYSASYLELADWSFTPSGPSRRNNILVRARLDSTWSPWLNVPTQAVSTNQLLNSRVAWDPEELITFRFADELPSYYQASDVEGFQAIAEGSPLMFETRELLSRFYGSTNLRFREALYFEESADINIFLADNIDDNYAAFHPGPDQGGDIILGSEIYSNELEPVAAEAQHQLLRAVGETLGLNQVENADWDQTLMGVEQASGAELRFYPGLQDLVVLDELYGKPDKTDTTAILFHDETNTRQETKRGFHTIQAGESFGSFDGREFFVDLREGASSRVEVDGQQKYTLVNPMNSYVLNAVGSKVVDFISGNSGNNNISAGLGDDWLNGREGDDDLDGGGGNDRFVYSFGDGNDIVSGGIGVDSLRLKNRFGFSIETLAEDLTFKRVRNSANPREHDLLIELTLNSNSAEGSILLEQMSNTNHRTESLLLNDSDGVLQRVSFVNLFSQVGFGRTKFDFAEGSNEYGRLVVPV